MMASFRMACSSWSACVWGTPLLEHTASISLTVQGRVVHVLLQELSNLVWVAFKVVFRHMADIGEVQFESCDFSRNFGDFDVIFGRIGQGTVAAGGGRDVGHVDSGVDLEADHALSMDLEGSSQPLTSYLGTSPS